MPAIITDDTKKILIEKIIADTSDSDTRYFVGIGKSDTWQDSTDIAPIAGQVINSSREQINFRSNLQSVILTDTVSFVAKRYNWSSGTIYRAFEGDVSALGIPGNEMHWKLLIVMPDFITAEIVFRCST